MNLDAEYWDNRYLANETGWDIGYISTPLKDYFDQLKDKSVKILVPGAGNAYEVEYLYHNGFLNVYLLDISNEAITGFLKRVPDFPREQIIHENFFSHNGKYDLIIEQTFFSSLPKTKRKDYAKKMNELLNDQGKLTGILFNHDFGNDHPPYGGTEEEYQKLFDPYFKFRHFGTAYNSIKPRKGRELFLCLVRK